MKKIVWLASYPKSGNTWTRIFLTNLLKKSSEGANNELLAPILASRNNIEEYLMLETSELSDTEVEDYTPLALRELSKDITCTPYFMKAHDAFIYTSNKEPLYPADVSIGAVYIVRNPLDVVVSFAHHNNDTIDNTIKIVSKPDFVLLNNKKDVKPQLRQTLLSWSGHVSSWLEQKEMPILFIRYEDMHRDTFNVFKKIINFSGLSYSEEEIKQAIDSASFDKLQQQEANHGFREKKIISSSFFRKGKIGSWRESLSTEQAKLIINQHRQVMETLGYLDVYGEPVY